MTTLSTQPQRFLLATFGSLGDLHPFFALGEELRKRGHHVTIASSTFYRETIEALGFSFAPLRPEMPDDAERAAFTRQVMNGVRGSDFLFRKLLLPSLTATRDDMRAAMREADALIYHPIVLPAGAVAEEKAKTQNQAVPRFSVLLQPLMLMSAYDPPITSGLEWVEPLVQRSDPRVTAAILKNVMRPFTRLLQPLNAMRRAMGLTPQARPFFDEARFADATLALFSRELAPPQPDWPPTVKMCGFCFHDRRGHYADLKKNDAASRALNDFLDAGAPPIVFTLGSAAVFDARDFFEESIRAARLLHRRALLLCGPSAKLPDTLPPGIAAFDYAPYSEVFPRAAAVVHQGGVGTSAQVMHAGVPTLVMPFSHDQPDNAARLRRLGMARVVSRREYSAPRVARELALLLNNPEYSENAAQVGENVRRENGPRTAAEAIEARLHTVLSTQSSAL